MKIHLYSTLSVLSLLAVFSAVPAVAGTLPPNFTEKIVATGLQSPSGIDVAADGRVFIGDQKGRVRVIVNDTLRTSLVLNIQTKTDYNVERGFQGLILDPDFMTNGYIYVYYTAISPASHNRLSRFTVVNNKADSTQETILFELPNLPARASFGCQNIDCNGSTSGTGTTALAVWHMGGGLIFGNDGKIYLGVGEHEVTSNSQSMTSLFGKILRLNKDGSIPSDNPFYNSAAGDLRAIYATGMRNPYTFGVQRSTGRIFLNDVGDGTWEEVDTLTPGGNYGWGTCEGRYQTGSTTTLCTISASVRPLFSYRHGTTTSTGNCVVGGGFTNNFRAQDSGKYFFGDFTNTTTATHGWIKSVNPLTGGDTATFATGYSNITGMTFSPNGSALYVLSRGYNTGTIDTVGTVGKIGQVYKLSYNLATSVQAAAGPARARSLRSLVALDGRSVIKVPQNATALRLYDMGGRTLWQTPVGQALTPGAQLSLPADLSGGVARAVWVLKGN